MFSVFSLYNVQSNSAIQVQFAGFDDEDLSLPAFSSLYSRIVFNFRLPSNGAGSQTICHSLNIIKNIGEERHDLRVDVCIPLTCCQFHG